MPNPFFWAVLPVKAVCCHHLSPINIIPVNHGVKNAPAHVLLVYLYGFIKAGMVYYKGIRQT